MRRQTDRRSSCGKKEYRRENIETREKRNAKTGRKGGREEERKEEGKEKKRREMKIEIMLTGERESIDTESFEMH